MLICMLGSRNLRIQASVSQAGAERLPPTSESQRRLRIENCR